MKKAKQLLLCSALLPLALCTATPGNAASMPTSMTQTTLATTYNNHEEDNSMFSIIIWAIASLGGGATLLTLLLKSFTVVEQQTLAAVERFGEYKRTAKPGLNLLVPFVDSAARRISLRIQQQKVSVDTITKDKVTVKVVVAVQYFVQETKAMDAFYKLDNPTAQIESFVFDQVRAVVPEMELDELFTNKDRIAQAVKDELAEQMDSFGLGVSNALVTDIEPDSKVVHAMNEINAAKRQRVAATEKGEADKIIVVKAAEADAAAKKLSGQGIADQREAIVKGLQQSVSDFTEAVEGADASTVMQLVLMTQYFDALKDMAANGTSKVILVPHSPGGLTDIAEQLRSGVLTGNELSSDGMGK